MVFGFLPYWEIGDVTLHMDVLTHIAYFGVSVGPDGTLGDSRHWNTETMAVLIGSARSHGVKVVLTVICFDGTDLLTLLNSTQRRATAIENIVDLVLAGDGDGVNIDFEGLPLAAKSGFVIFISDLKDALDAAMGESSVTVSMPAVDWKGSYDFDRLATVSDGLFLMEYGFHYQGGAPGPVAPLSGSDKWGKYSVTWSLDDYDYHGGTKNRLKFILGMPFFGYDWPADGTVPPSGFVSDGQAVSYQVCQAGADVYGPDWDHDSATPWFDYYSGGQYRQVWCDNHESLVMRMTLARDRGLGGIGFWALGYEGEFEEPWQAVADVWGPAGDQQTADPSPEEQADNVSVADAACIDDDVNSVPAGDICECFQQDTYADPNPDDGPAETSDTCKIASGSAGMDSRIPDSSDHAVLTNDAAAAYGGCQAGPDQSGGAAGTVIIMLMAVLLFELTRYILFRRDGRRP